jgi:hypothetical protein
VDYYDSGQFGDAICEHCDALLLKGEFARIKKGQKSQCCSNGECESKKMKDEYDELQKPPPEYLHGLIFAKDKALHEQFLDNTMTLNNTFAFASVHGEKAPEEELGGRNDTCKYNGCFFSYL